MTTTHYDRVGVSLTASTADIKRAYRKRARHAHPDHGGSATQFRLLTDAYEVLIDAGRRAVYDAELERSFRAPRTPEPERQSPPRSTPPRERDVPPQASQPVSPLPPRVVLDEPRLPARRSRALRRAERLCWVAAFFLVVYVVAAYVLVVDRPPASEPAPSYLAFVLVAATPLLIGIGARRRARVRGPSSSTAGWQVLGLFMSAAVAAVYVQTARAGDTVEIEARTAWVFATSAVLVPALLMISGVVLRRARAQALDSVVAEHVRWARATERRAHAEAWAAMTSAASRPDHTLWWVLEATREGSRTRVHVTSQDRTTTRTGTVVGPCFAHIWIVIDERTDVIARRCSDDRRQAWADELATASSA